MSRIKNIFVAADQLLNTLLGGYPGESISSRCWRCRESQPYKVLRVAIDFMLRPWGANHCEESFKNWREYVPEASNAE